MPIVSLNPMFQRSLFSELFKAISDPLKADIRLMPEEPTSRAVELICNTSLCYWQLVDMREIAGQSHLYKLSSAPLNHNPPRTFRHRAERIAVWHKVINHTLLRFTSKQWEYETRAESRTCVNKNTKLKGIKDLCPSIWLPDFAADFWSHK